MNKRLRVAVLAAVLAGTALHATGAPAADAVPDRALEARVQALAAELRCLVCQNQSLADSNAPLAVDLKNQVREQLRAGRNEADVVTYMTDRYGDFVLYRPPFKGTTLLLWGGPALLLMAGAWALWRALARQHRTREAPPVEEAERLRAEKLLRGGDSS